MMALVRRRTRRGLFVAWQILVVVIDTVVDVWRLRGGVVMLAARVPTRLSAVLGGRHPVAKPGASVLFVVVTYIVGSVLGRRVRGAVVAGRGALWLGVVVRLARRGGRVGRLVGGVVLGRAAGVSRLWRRSRRIRILSRREVAVPHAWHRRVRRGSVVLRHVVWRDYRVLCLEHRGPMVASRRAGE